MMRFLIICLCFTVNLNISAAPKCKELQSHYIIGDYKACSDMKNITSPECKYIKILCHIATEGFEQARFLLSELTSNQYLHQGEIAGLSINSLVEIAFATGEFDKARKL